MFDKNLVDALNRQNEEINKFLNSLSDDTIVDGKMKQTINGEEKMFTLENGEWVEVAEENTNEGLHYIRSTVTDLFDTIEEPTEEQEKLMESALDELDQMMK